MHDVECPFDGVTHQVRDNDEEAGGMDMTAHVLTYIEGLDPNFRGDSPRAAYVWIRDNQDAQRLRCTVRLSDLVAGFTGG